MPARATPLRVLARALALRCPQCGERGLVVSWFQVAEVCPHCDFAPFRADEGLAVGAYAINLVLAEFIALGSALIVMLAMWPDPAWNVVLGVGIVLAIVMPLVTYPASKTLFMGLNLIVRVNDPEPPRRG